jgi:hypothetical protein
MQGEPWDHLMPGLTVKDYVRHGGGEPLMPLSAVARSDLAGLAFRDGYAPFAPFTGSLVDESRWRRRNWRRLAVLQQPAALWGGTAGCDTSSWPPSNPKPRTPTPPPTPSPRPLILVIARTRTLALPLPTHPLTPR